MHSALEQQRRRLRGHAERLVASALMFEDEAEVGRMLDRAIATMARERVIGRLASR